MTRSEPIELPAAGRGVLRYTATSGTPPTADLAELLTSIEEALPVIMRELAGWQIATRDPGLAAALRGAGCSAVRHGHVFSRDLVLNPPDPDWLTPDLPGLRLKSLDRPASDLVDVSLAAYPPGHPDAETDDPAVVERLVGALLTGDSVGPFMAVSTQVLDGPAVVAVAIINRMPGAPPMGGPWVSEVCRDPDRRYAGLGSVMLRRIMAELSEGSEKSLSLVVTEGNPARRTYERLGFAHVDSFRKLLVPG